MRCLIFICFLILVNGCHKKPVANFETDKTEYGRNEIVKIKNTSTGAYTNKWTFPDAPTNTFETPTYTTNVIKVGPHKIKLEVTSKDGKKVSEIEKTIEIIGGTVKFWKTTSNYRKLRLYADNQLISEEDVLYFGSQSALTFSLPVGEYHYYIYDGVMGKVLEYYFKISYKGEYVNIAIN